MENISDFWSLIWDETNVIGEKGSNVVDSSAMPADNPAWFSDARLNWAENMLRFRSPHKTALIHAGKIRPHKILPLSSRLTKELGISISQYIVEPTPDEPSPPVRKLSYNQLYHLVADIVSSLLLVPVRPGDRVASYSSNCIVSSLQSLFTQLIIIKLFFKFFRKMWQPALR